MPVYEVRSETKPERVVGWIETRKVEPGQVWRFPVYRPIDVFPQFVVSPARARTIEHISLATKVFRDGSGEDWVAFSDGGLPAETLRRIVGFRPA